MTVREFFNTKRGTDYYTVNIVNINTDEEIVTNADEIDDGVLDYPEQGIYWGNCEIQTWEISGEMIYLGVI